jgi:ankyrin repeat protein
MRKAMTMCALLSSTLFSAAVAQETRSGTLPSELPLHTAIAAGDLDEVRRLLVAGADANARISMFGVDLRTPLSVAFYDWPGAEGGSTDVVQLLLKAGADPNGAYNVYGGPGYGEPPLGFAASSPVLLRMLLEAGADPNIGWCFRGKAFTAFMMAEMDEQAESTALLRSAGAQGTSLDLALARDAAGAALHAAVFASDAARVKRLLDAGSDPKAALPGLRFVSGEVERLSALRLALSFDEDREVDPAVRAEVVRLLLAAGADANESFEFMCGLGRPTALLMAVAGGAEDVVALLLKAGADPNAGAEAFEASLLRPLIIAVGDGNTSMVQLLLDAGADPNAVSEADDARFNALDVALSAERPEIAEILRARGAVASEPAADGSADDRHPRDFAPDDGLPHDFAPAWAACSAGSRFDSSNPMLGASVRYEIVGPEDDDCRVSLTYTSNPNPEWEGKPLLLTLDPLEPFLAQIMAGMEQCMTGGASRFNCAGPLLEVLRRN